MQDADVPTGRAKDVPGIGKGSLEPAAINQAVATAMADFPVR